MTGVATSVGVVPPAPTEWNDLASPSGFERCVRGTMREVYGYVGLLVGRDREAAERITSDVYRSLFRVAQSGRIESVTLGALRSAGRELWIDQNRIAVLAQASAGGESERAATLDDLIEVERAVIVFCHVNRMPTERVARELGIEESRVRAIESRAITRLRGHDDGGGKWLRAFYGESVVPVAGLADRIIDRLDGSTGLLRRPARPTGAIGADAAVPTAMVPDVTRPLERGLLPEALDGEVAAASVAPVAKSSAEPDVELDTLRPDPIKLAPRRWPIVVGAMLVLALIAGIVLLAGGGDEDQAATTEPPVVTTPATAAPIATSPPTVVTTAPPATTAAPIVPHFEPACAATADAGEIPSIDESALDSFGPLGAEPNLVISVPQVVTAAGPGVATVDVQRAPGGVLLSVRPESVDGFEAGVSARVGSDGSVAWVQCNDPAVEVVPARALLGGDEDIPEWIVGGPGPGTWSAMSIADGTAADEPVDPTTVTAVLDELAAPAVAPPGEPYVAYLDEGLAGFDADGNRIWTDTTAHPPADEGFLVANVAAGSLVTWCPNPADDPGCENGQLRGYNAATGVGLWQLEGRRQVAVVDGRYAIVSEPGEDGDVDWIMITIRDGQPVEGQRWTDPDTFLQACCAEGDVTWVRVLGGGVVAVAKPGSISIWYPAEAELGRATVSIP